MPMTLGPHGLDLIKSFESFVPYVYDDLVPPVKGKYKEWDGGPVKGTLTIGWGHTDAALDPLKCHPGTRITMVEADKVLMNDLSESVAQVNREVHVPVTQGQFDALVSFTFNCGIKNLRRLVEPLNDGDADGTRSKFDQYIRSKGKVLNGLVRRRDAEQKLWDDDYEGVAQAVPAPDKPVLTPKDVTHEEPPKPAVQSTTIWASIAAIIATLGTQLSDLLKDWHWVVAVAILILLVYIIWERVGKPDISGLFKTNSGSAQ